MLKRAIVFALVGLLVILFLPLIFEVFEIEPMICIVGVVLVLLGTVIFSLKPTSKKEDQKKKNNGKHIRLQGNEEFEVIEDEFPEKRKNS